MEKISVIKALDALAHDTRLDIFRLLVGTGPKGLMMGEVGQRLDLPGATLSFHMDKLRQAGLVTQRRDGRATWCSPNYAALVGTLRYLTENCCKEADMPCTIEITDKKECC
jgi:DNA-binding transcriptional ArsR family regulator